MHIAWLILKIILLTLGILLGIALILLLLLLFVPIRYQVDASMQKKPEAKVRVSWMSFFLDLRAQYREGEFLYYLRSFWVLLATNDEDRMKAPKKEHHTASGKKESRKKAGRKKQTTTDPQDTEKPQEDDIPLIDIQALQELDALGRDDLEPWEEGDSEEEKGTFWDKLRVFFHILELVFTLPARIVAGIYIVCRKLRNVTDHVMETLGRLQKKLKLLNKKRQQVVKLWGLPTTKTAIKNCKGYLLDLLKHLKPKKLSGRLIIGCNDPAATGQIFGILGLLLPVYYDNIDITADFEQARVEGDIHMKGGITIFYLLYLLLKIYRDKYTMKTYERVKKILGGN